MLDVRHAWVLLPHFHDHQHVIHVFLSTNWSTHVLL